jgi:hypothetical protein
MKIMIRITQLFVCQLKLNAEGLGEKHNEKQ